MISSQVPLAVVSKTLRHSKLSIKVDTYGHLVPHAAQQAVDAISDALTTTERPGPRDAVIVRPHRDHIPARRHPAMQIQEHGRTDNQRVDLHQPGDPRSGDEEWS